MGDAALFVTAKRNFRLLLQARFDKMQLLSEAGQSAADRDSSPGRQLEGRLAVMPLQNSRQLIGSELHTVKP